MKLLMTADAIGGVWTYALDLCAALDAFDVEIVLATMGARPQPSQRAAVAGLGNVELVESDFALEWMENPWRDVEAAGDWLLYEAHSHDVELIHLNGYAHAGLAWNRPVVSVAHSCVISWWRAVHGEEAPSEWNEYRKRVRVGLLAADRIVAPTESFATQLAQAHALDRAIDVIPNGRACVDSDGDGDGAARVIACGRAWDAAKNFALLDDIAQRCSWPIHLIGAVDGPNGQRWQPRHLQCLGPMSAEQVTTQLSSSAIFVHPALYEPFGLVVVEAAHAGCCLVLADLPGLRELWQDAAVFFDPQSAASLHAALNAVIEDPPLRARLARAAAQRARTYSSQAMARGYFDLYRDMLANHREVRKAVA